MIYSRWLALANQYYGTIIFPSLQVLFLLFFVSILSRPDLTAGLIRHLYHYQKKQKLFLLFSKYPILLYKIVDKKQSNVHRNLNDHRWRRKPGKQGYEQTAETHLAYNPDIKTLQLPAYRQIAHEVKSPV